MRIKLIVAALGLLSAMEGVANPKKIEAVPYCIINSDVVMIKTIIESKGQRIGAKAGEPQDTYRDYWSINCDISTGSCVASKLYLKSLEAGKPISFVDLIQPSGMRLVSVVGNVATIVWGINLFSFDMSKKTVAFRQSGDTYEMFGSGPCLP